MESTNNGKAKIYTSFEGIQVTVPSLTNWFVLLFGTAWLGGWITGFDGVSNLLFSNDSDPNGIEWFLMLWLVLWTIGGIFVIGLLLWGYFGKETFLITKNQVKFNKTIFGIGIKKVLNMQEIKNIRFNEIKVNWRDKRHSLHYWGAGEGKIKFDYGMKTYSFGLGLDDAEANYLVDLLKKEMRQEPNNVK
ncbi:MAG: hypothetical protein AB8B69_22025 [Chitinophagales bacterium]